MRRLARTSTIAAVAAVMVGHGSLMASLSERSLDNAAADTITFRGSSIPLPGCTIEDISGGEVLYRDARGRRQRRSLDEIHSLVFEGLSPIADAEDAMAAEDYGAAIAHFLQAMVNAQTPLQREWLHARLATAHNYAEQYVQAAGHAAAAMALSDDSYWRSLEPSAEVDEPSYAAAHEAVVHLHAAAKTVKNAELKSAVDRMTRAVQTVYDRLAASYSGPPIAAGSTISGVAIEAIGSGAAEDAAAPPAAPSSPPQATQPAREPEQSPPSPSSSSSSSSQPGAAAASRAPGDADAIDQLLAAGRYDEALRRCQQALQAPDQRDAAHLLYQCGVALARSDRPRDAAVMFTRSAVLFPNSTDGVLSLIETALIYRDEFGKPETAARLLERARDRSAAAGHEDLTRVAEELLAGGQ